MFMQCKLNLNLLIEFKIIIWCKILSLSVGGFSFCRKNEAFTYMQKESQIHRIAFEKALENQQAFPAERSHRLVVDVSGWLGWCDVTRFRAEPDGLSHECAPQREARLHFESGERTPPDIEFSVEERSHRRQHIHRPYILICIGYARRREKCRLVISRSK